MCADEGAHPFPAYVLRRYSLGAIPKLGSAWGVVVATNWLQTLRERSDGDVLERERSKIQIVLCGPKASGKTVFISTLSNMPQIIDGDDKTTQMLQADRNLLAKGERWPDATELTVRELFFETRFRGRNVELFINDYDGQLSEKVSDTGAVSEEFREELDRFRAMLQAASGLIFLFPYGDDNNIERIERYRSEMSTFIRLARQVSPDGRPEPVPAVIGVNKWDRSEFFGHADEVDKVDAYVRQGELYRDAYATLAEWLDDITVMPISVLAHNEDTSDRPGTIRPRNVLEAVQHLIERAFDGFEAQYKKTASLPPDQRDKSRYILFSTFRRETKSFDNFENERAQIEDALTADFVRQFSEQDPQDIVDLASENEWFFSRVEADRNRDALLRAYDTALDGKFTAGLSEVTVKGPSAVAGWKRENGWLFEQLAHAPRYLEKYASALARSQHAQTLNRVRRGAIAAGCVSLAVLTGWVSIHNVIELNRFRDQVASVDPRADNLASVCLSPREFVKRYESTEDRFGPPLFFRSAHLSEARRVIASANGAMAEKVMDAVALARAGQRNSLSEVQADLSSLRLLIACVDRGFLSSQGKDVHLEFARYEASATEAINFVMGVRRLEGQGSAASCEEINEKNAVAKSIVDITPDVQSARATVAASAALCERADLCNQWLVEISRATDLNQIQRLVGNGERRQACEAASARLSSPVISEIASRRDAALDAINNKRFRSRLRTEFRSERELNDAESAITAIESEKATAGGALPPYKRSTSLSDAIEASRTAIERYRGTRSVTVSRVRFTNGSIGNERLNPLWFECGNSLRSQIAIALGDGSGFYNDCVGSGGNSSMTVTFSTPKRITAGRNFSVNVWRRSSTWAGGSLPQQSTRFSLTRDNMYKLMTDGAISYNWSGRSYGVTLYTE